MLSLDDLSHYFRTFPALCQYMLLFAIMIVAIYLFMSKKHLVLIVAHIHQQSTET